MGRACTIFAVRISEVTVGSFNGAWLDRHGIRPSYLGLGGPPLLGLGVRPPRSVSHLYPMLTLMLRVLRCCLLHVDCCWLLFFVCYNILLTA